MSLRVIVPEASLQIADTELEIKAHNYPERVEKQTTIKDLKKHLGVTHPTVLSRLKTLQLQGFIELKKEGREKFITLTSKGIGL